MKIIVILGPTATGKSKLAHEIAHENNYQIISADSRLVYKYMNIGTAKPSKQELSQVKYHMINILEPSYGEYSMSEYSQEARNIINNINNIINNKIIVTGGTGFYIQGLLENINLTEIKPNKTFRDSLQKFSAEELYLRLINKRNIHPNDRFRIIRALEIQEYSCQAINKQTNKTNNFVDNLEILWIGLNPPERNNLRERIKKRTQKMLSEGILEETSFLLEKYGELEIFNKTIGYKECIEFLQKKSISSQEELEEKIIISTAQYAKRQITWFKRNKKISWFNPESELEIKQAKNIIKNF